MLSTQLPAAPSPLIPPLPPPGTMRKDNSASPQPIQLASHKRPSQSRRPSRARIDPSQKLAEDTVADFALEHLFALFIKEADHKIDSVSSSVAKSRISDDIEDVCGVGADANFDKLLTAMGHIARKQPEVLVNKVGRWKLFHDEAASVNAQDTGPTMVGGDRSGLEPSPGMADSVPSTRAEHPVTRQHMETMGDRRASAATYLMCRALTALLNQTTLESLTKQVAVRLEEAMFDCSIKIITYDGMKKSPLQRAKWEQATDVLGILSRLHFGGVCGRYAQILQECQEILAKGEPGSGAEGEARNMLKGMRKLLPRATEQKHFIEFSSHMGELVNLFGNAHGEVIKIEYCRMFETLLLRFARESTVGFEDDKWRRTTSALHEKLHKLNLKIKYRDIAYPALIALACVSPNSMFASRWRDFPSVLSARLSSKEQRHRAPILKSACRMSWIYLLRSQRLDSSNRTTLDEVVKIVFFSKKYFLSRDASIIEPLIQLVRIIAQFDSEYAFKNIIFPLIQDDLFKASLGRDPSYQSLDPDKVITGIRAFLATIVDLENAHKSTFPVTFPDDEESYGSALPVPMSPAATTFRSVSRKDSVVRSDRLSRPVITQQLSPSMKANYAKFCHLLNRILRVCDTAFGGQASLDEKFLSTGATRGPLFVDAWSFAGRDDDEHQAERSGKLGFLDLLHVAVQAIPRCLSSDTPIKNVVDLLCTGTAHTERDIAASSASSLRSIARQGYAEVIAARFAFFIFRYDERYRPTTDGGALGLPHIESTLQLWIELLKIWEDELLQKAKESSLELPSLNVPNSMTIVDRVESQGLFLLCSPSNHVRARAIEVLSIVTRLDKALEGSITRVHDVLTGAAPTLFPPKLEGRDNEFSSIEKANLEKMSQERQISSSFVRLCGGSSDNDSALWYKLFPNFIQTCHRVCPTSVVLTRDDVCTRLAHIQSLLDVMPEERSRATTVGSFDASANRAPSRAHNGPPRALTDQYKLCLTFACSTIQKQDSSNQSLKKEPSHVRKSSRSSAGSQETFDSAQNLFSKVVPMVYNDFLELRQAAVAGLISINPGLYHLLLQTFDMQTRSLPAELRGHYVHARAASSPRIGTSHPIYRQELVQIYERTSHFLLEHELHRDEWIMHHLSSFTWSLHEYLRQDEIFAETSSIRRHYCGLIQNFYLASVRSSDPGRWMPFAKRKAHYMKIEEWFNDTTPAEPNTASNGMHSPRARPGFGHSDRDTALEHERLRTATSSAMATLCAGPFQTSKPELDDQFQVPRFFGFAHKLFRLEGDKPQATGRRALINLISNNKQYPVITETISQNLFVSTKQATIESYLDVLLHIFEQPDPPRVREWKLLAPLLFTLGNTHSSVRMKSARLLRIFEEKNQCSSHLRNHEVGISDRTPAVNRQAHFDISNELKSHHHGSHFACCLFSEYADHFVRLKPDPEHAQLDSRRVVHDIDFQAGTQPDSQRIMILVLLPWMRAIELQKDRQAGYTPATYMVLLNLVFITIHCSTVLQNEIQALWQSLLLDHAGNARCILDFVIDLAMEKRDPKYLRTAKQIVVYLATANAESTAGVIDFLLSHIGPKHMNTTEVRANVQKPDGANTFAYVVGLNTVFPDSDSPFKFSMGQLSLILLVDLVVRNASIPLGKLPELLQIILVLWDHHSAIVQEQAREMLVHLVHVFVISKADASLVNGRTPSIEELVELIRRQDSKVGWGYSDSADPSGSGELPPAMRYVVSEALALFSLTIPGIHELWGSKALTWALQCPVRHIACRSMQIYRLILRPLGQLELSEMLNRTSSTIADQSPEYQGYAVEILRTIHAVIRVQPPDSCLLPRIYWTTCAALDSVHEWEYAEALSMLSDILEKLDLLNEYTVTSLMANRPQDWDCTLLSSFIPQLYRGCSSRVNHVKSLGLINRAMRIGCHPMFCDVSCLQLGILANLPRLLHSYDNPDEVSASIESACALRDCCHMMKERALAAAFEEFATTKPSRNAFLATCLAAMQQNLFRSMPYECIEFLMRQLLNPKPWIRSGTLQVIQSLLPRLDKDDARVKAQGLDLFSPLIKLLQTEYCEEALKVVDEILSVSGTSKDLLHLRTAQANHDPTRRSFKPAPAVGSLYGVSTETGWTFLDPATHNKRPRSMINAVANFQVVQADATIQPTTLTPEVEFHKEELLQDSYFPHTGAREPRFAEAGMYEGIWDVPPSARFDTNISQLTAQLDDLDDFFEDNASETAVESETNNSSTVRITRRDEPYALHQSKPSMAPPSTPKSHQKLESTSSFVADVANVSMNASPALPPQTNSVAMSPSAFASPPAEPQAQSRPGMPPRAATMPVSNLQTTPPDRSNAKGAVDSEPCSDDDVAVGRTHADRTDSGTASRNNTPQKPFSSLRSSLKRFTSGGERHRRAVTRVVPAASPQVPPVPSEYLPPPHSDVL